MWIGRPFPMPIRSSSSCGVPVDGERVSEIVPVAACDRVGKFLGVGEREPATIGLEFGPPLVTVERDFHLRVDNAVGPESLPEFFESGGQGGLQIGIHRQAVHATGQAERRTGGPALSIEGEHEVGRADFTGELFHHQLAGVGRDIWRSAR